MSRTRRLSLIAAFAACLAGPALAQSPACNAWRAELASLPRGGGGDGTAARTAQRLGAELSQTINRSRSLGCDRGGFVLFGDSRPAECGMLNARIGQLQEQYSAAQRLSGGTTDQRRAQLASLIDSQCRPGVYQTPERPRGFFETIFGIDPDRGQIESTLPELDPNAPLDDKPKLGGSRAVCVRTCDGFFFPLAASGGNPDEMCQAQCPAADTAVFYMAPDGDIVNALGRNGQPYSSLPNAAKYTRSFDAGCTCRAPGQSWIQALRDAEDLLDRRKGDIIVSAERAAEMSRPRDPKADPKKRGAAAVPPPAPAATPAADPDQPMPSLNSPTAGTESAGVGPQTIETGGVVRQGVGLRREIQLADGERKTVRIVAPNLAPNLSPGTAPATARP